MSFSKISKILRNDPGIKHIFSLSPLTGNITGNLSTRLIKPNFVSLTHRYSTTVSLEARNLF